MIAKLGSPKVDPFPKAVQRESDRMIGRPSLSRNARPWAIVDMPKVAMKGCIPP